jgi:hypothetical protein
MGTWGQPNEIHYEKVDPTYYVRSKDFFFEGRVLAIIMKESIGSRPIEMLTAYNSSDSIDIVKHDDNYVHMNIRRFVVVRQMREFCYACPIFTYSGEATTKHGVRASEHGIAHSWGQPPQLLPGESGITKPSISVVMAQNVPELQAACRIYYGIIHPIQYNVKVKEIGYVPQAEISYLIGNWQAEEDRIMQDAAVTESAYIPEEEDENKEYETGQDETSKADELATSLSHTSLG